MGKQLLGMSGLVVATMLLATRPASGWDNRGHELVALLAYRELVDDPATQAKIQAVLKEHPHFGTYLTKGNRPADVTPDEWAFMRAATWPDSVRPPSKNASYHRATWHYVNKPFLLLPDGPDAEKTRLDVEKRFSSTKENHGDILIAFPDCRRVVRDATARPEDRAVRLCWVLHLAGDIHQPLHATTLCTKEMPAGDRGGHMVYVRRRANTLPTPLHTVWDHLLNQGSGAGVDMLARDIRMNVPFTAAERKVGDIGAWAEESYELARTGAYAFNGATIDFVIDLDGGEAPPDAPRLPDGYEAAAVQIARKRALLAGLRLADVLAADFRE